MSIQKSYIEPIVLTPKLYEELVVDPETLRVRTEKPWLLVFVNKFRESHILR